VLHDERIVLPVGAFNAKYGVTLSLPCVVGKDGAGQIFEPAMSPVERQAFEKSAEVLRDVGKRLVGTNSKSCSTISTPV